MKPYTQATRDLVKQLASNAEKWTAKRVPPDLPPADGMTYGKRSDENVQQFNTLYFRRMNEMRIANELPHIPEGRFIECATP